MSRIKEALHQKRDELEACEEKVEELEKRLAEAQTILNEIAVDTEKIVTFLDKSCWKVEIGKQVQRMVQLRETLSPKQTEKP